MELNGNVLVLEVKGEKRELRFDKIGFIRRLDEVYKAEKGGIEFGFGVMFANVYLEQYSVPALANVIKCGLFKEKGITLNDVDEAIEKVAENGDLEALFEMVIEALGKSQIVQVTVAKLEKAQGKNKVTESE